MQLHWDKISYCLCNHITVSTLTGSTIIVMFGLFITILNLTDGYSIRRLKNSYLNFLTFQLSIIFRMTGDVDYPIFTMKLKISILVETSVPANDIAFQSVHRIYSRPTTLFICLFNELCEKQKIYHRLSWNLIHELGLVELETIFKQPKYIYSLIFVACWTNRIIPRKLSQIIWLSGPLTFVPTSPLING